jgi:hypothetical protein
VVAAPVGRRVLLDERTVPGVMERSPKSRVEIECLVLRELQASENCGGAAGISIIGLKDPRNEANWTVAAYKPGTSGKEECDLALQSIVPRFQGFYELVQKH